MGNRHGPEEWCEAPHFDPMLSAYRELAAEREAQGVPALALTAEQTQGLTELLQTPPAGEDETLLHLLSERIPPGVDEAAYVKATWLSAVAQGDTSSPLVSPLEATRLLGTMVGGYNVAALIELLKHSDTELAACAAAGLSRTLLVYDAFNEVMDLAESNRFAKQVVDSWAAAEWFTSKPELADSITVTVFKVEGETNTDDLSPATHATTRPDIPLHALAMLETRDPEGLNTIATLKQKGHPVAYVGDVVGTGSSRKSAINSVLWHTGDDIPHVPNKRAGGVILGGKIAPIFFNTAEDSGALPIECDVTQLNTGDVITIRPHAGTIERDGTVVSRFELNPSTIRDEVRAGGRIPLMIGRALTDKVRAKLGLPPSDLFIRPSAPEDTGKGFTLAQKMVGKACGLPGVRPGTSCEPLMTTVGSQDTTGPMTRDEMKELACLGFSSDLVMQSFCHTAAYPKPVDLQTQKDLPDFFAQRGGVALRPGDGIIHSWLNRMLLPDTVGTGGDSHTRFPLGISFPAGSGLVAFAAAIGAMPLDMPESVLVRFSGSLQPGVTLRDVVNAIPWVAIQRGLLTVEKANKKNLFNGRIMEIEGLPDLKLEQAFELTDASAERSCAGCTIKLSEETVSEYLRSNVAAQEHDRPWLQRCAHPGPTDQGDGNLAGPAAAAQRRCRCGLRRGAGDQPRRTHRTGGGLPERSRQREAAQRGGRRSGAGGVHRLLHDQHRPLPSRRQGAGGRRSERGTALGLPAHPYGRGNPEGGGLLRHLRSRRLPHGDAWLLPLHGQPGSGGGQHHSVFHQHP